MLNIKEQHTSIAPKGFAYILHTAHDYWQHIAGTYVVEHAITQLFIYFRGFCFCTQKKEKSLGYFFYFVDEVLCGDDLLYVNVFEGWHGAGGGDEFEKYGGCWFINPIVK